MNNDFVEYLKDELATRCEKNHAYSLRSFASHLNISHTTLSEVMAGKRPLTPKTRDKISRSLGLTDNQLQEVSKSKGESFNQKFEKINVQHFEILSEWQHDAILELTHLKTFKPDCRWIALVLDLHIHQVEIAVDRLFELGYLKLGKGGKWIDVSVNNTNNHVGDFTNLALRKYQKGLIQRSLTSLENVPREYRDHSSLMLHFSKSDLKKAKEMIREFRTDLLSFAEKNKSPDEVYALSIAFFPISNGSERKL